MLQNDDGGWARVEPTRRRRGEFPKRYFFRRLSQASKSMFWK